jgi:GGDEF domain-containing protein
MMYPREGPFIMSESQKEAQVRVHDLRERWRATSLASVWIRPNDWEHPAAEALAEALAEGRDVIAPAERLGAARAAVGAGITEALDDVACLYAAFGRPTDVGALRAAAIGWVGERERVPYQIATHDPSTGLPTGEYLGERLRETYGTAQRSGSTAGSTHCLLVLDVGLDNLDTWQRLARSAAIGRTLHQVFGEGHPMAAIGDGTFVVLCERGPSTAELGQSLRRVVERNAEVLGLTTEVRRPTRVWVERLPGTHDDALLLLDHLAR